MGLGVVGGKLCIVKIAYIADVFINKRKIIFGMESWWSRIKSEKELMDITNDDIEDVWYVKMLKGMGGRKENGQ